jgi:hypothetical protein
MLLSVTGGMLSDVLNAAGIGTVDYWRGVGVTKAQMRTLLRSGQLVAVRRGVYATRLAVASGEADPARGHALQVSAIRMAVGRDAVASHQSAALIHGLSLLKTVPAGTVTMTRPPRARSRSRPAAGVVFHAAELPSAHVTRLYGTQVTAVARTVVDLARSLPFLDGVVVADSALHGWPVGAELGQVLGACQGWPGIAQARRVVEFGNGRAESVLESAARVVFDARGLAAPELQVVIRGTGFTFRVDFLWAAHRTVVEADGLTKYSSRDDILAQFRRDRLLRDAGYKVVHFTWRELFETPEVVIKRIRTAFAARGPF